MQVIMTQPSTFYDIVNDLLLMEQFTHLQLSLNVSFCQIDNWVFAFSYFLVFTQKISASAISLQILHLSFKYCKIQKEPKAFPLASEKLSTEICLCTETLDKNFIMQEQNFIDGEYKEALRHHYTFN